MTEVLDILRRALVRLDDPSSWARGHHAALDASGSPCEPDSPEAVRWAVWGALFAEPNIGQDVRLAAMKALRRVLSKDDTLLAFNERARHSDVLSLYSEAIAETASTHLTIARRAE